MSIASDIIRGHTDAIILARLSAGDSYGYEINKAILRKTERQVRAEGGYAVHGVQAAGGIRQHNVLLGERGHGRAQAVLCHNGTGQEELRGAA